MVVQDFVMHLSKGCIDEEVSESHSPKQEAGRLLVLGTHRRVRESVLPQKHAFSSSSTIPTAPGTGELAVLAS